MSIADELAGGCWGASIFCGRIVFWEVSIVMKGKEVKGVEIGCIDGRWIWHMVEDG